MNSNLQLITECLETALSLANGGVQAFVLADGILMTNYVPVRQSTMFQSGMTLEERAWALQEWRRLTGAPGGETEPVQEMQP